MSSRNDVSFSEWVLGKLIVTIVVFGSLLLVKHIWFSPPSNGAIVAVSQFGSKDYLVHWDCKDPSGYYGCQGTANNKPKYYDVPSDYEVVDSYGSYSTSNKHFVCRDLRTHYEYFCDFGTSEGSFVLKDQIIRPVEGLRMVGIAERQGGNFWFHYQKGDTIYEYHGSQLKDTFTIPAKTRFIGSAMFYNKSKPERFCLVGEKPVECPKD